MARKKAKNRKVYNLDEFLKFKNNIDNDEFYTGQLGNYLVGSYGNLFNLKTKSHLRAHPDQTGRMTYYNLDVDGDTHTIKRYRLVALFFCDTPADVSDLDLLFNDDYVVHHLDGCEIHDMYCNLVWMTKSDHQRMERLLSCGKLKREDIDTAEKIYKLYPLKLNKCKRVTNKDYNEAFKRAVFRYAYNDYCIINGLDAHSTSVLDAYIKEDNKK